MAGVDDRRLLAGWRKLSDFCALCLWSGWVKGERPASALLVGPPGTIKTKIVERFRVNKWIEYFSDVTMQQLLPVLRHAQQGNTRFVCITELNKVIGRRRAVAASTLNLIGEAIEEGVHRVAYGPVSKDYGGAGFGLLGASTNRAMFTHRAMMDDIALESRIFMLDASATDDEVRALERLIANGDKRLISPIILPVPDRAWPVGFPTRLARRMLRWTDEIRRSRRARVYGGRTLVNLMCLVRGAALQAGRQTVREQDLERVYVFRKLWLEPPVYRDPNDDD